MVQVIGFFSPAPTAVGQQTQKDRSQQTSSTATILEFPINGLTRVDLAAIRLHLPRHDVTAYRTDEGALFAVVDGETAWSWSIVRTGKARYEACDAFGRTLATGRTLNDILALIAIE